MDDTYHKLESSLIRLAMLVSSIKAMSIKDILATCGLIFFIITAVYYQPMIPLALVNFLVLVVIVALAITVITKPEERKKLL